MKDLLFNKLTLVWILLCTGTLVSQLLGGNTDDPTNNIRTVGVAILVIAFIKAHLVLHYFMGLERAPVRFRQLFGAWVVLVAIMLIVLY